LIINLVNDKIYVGTGGAKGLAAYVPNPTPLQSFFIERFTVTQDNRRR
jgi:hypothetical protein